MTGKESIVSSDLLWEIVDGELWLRMGRRHVAVPPLLSSLLVGDAGCGLSDDPTADILRLEQDLRRYADFVNAQASAAADHVAYGCRAIARLQGRWRGRRFRRLACEYLNTAAQLHLARVTEHCRVQSWIAQVRQFVIDADVPQGLLVEATAGWRRQSDKPQFVVEFGTLASFIEADLNRADPDWWAGHTDVPGEVHGQLWRRDGDDDDSKAAPLPRSGPWQLVHLRQTGEIYGYRLGGNGSEKVWLLSTGWHDDVAACQLIKKLMAHMREPNSIILAAETLHAGERNRQKMSPDLHGSHETDDLADDMEDGGDPLPIVSEFSTAGDGGVKWR